MPVTPTCQPTGAAAVTAWSIAGRRLPPPEPGHRGRVDQGEGGPAVAGDEGRVVRGRVVRDPHVGYRPGQGGEPPPGGGGGSGVGDLLPGRHGDHRQVGGLGAAVAVLAGDLVVDLERLPGHGEVVGHPVGSATDGHHADSRHDDPEQGHERLVTEDEAGERRHRDLLVRTGGRSASCNSRVPPQAPAGRPATGGTWPYHRGMHRGPRTPGGVSRWSTGGGRRKSSGMLSLASMEGVVAAWRRWFAPPVRDAILAVIVTAILLVGSYGEGSPASPPDRIQSQGHAAPHPGAALILVAVAGLALIWRRRAPVVVL